MKLMKLALLITPALMLATPVYAGDEGDRGKRHKQYSHHDRGGDTTDGMIRAMRAFHGLDLSETQKADLHEIAQSVKTDLKANRKASHENRKALHALLQSGEMDEAALAEIAEEEGRLTAERVLIAGTGLSHGLALLDETQRAELHEKVQQHKQRRAHKRSEAGS